MHSKIADHTKKKGVFIAPLNTFSSNIEEFNSWVVGKVPEYLWIGLIFDYYDRNEAMRRLNEAINILYRVAPEMQLPKISLILNLPEQKQELIFTDFIKAFDPKALAPLSLLFTFSKYRCFIRYFFCKELSFDNRIEKIRNTTSRIMSKDTVSSTDIQYIVACFIHCSRKIVYADNSLNHVRDYQNFEPNSLEQRMAGCAIRAMLIAYDFMITSKGDKPNEDYIKWFWNRVTSITECKTYIVNFQSEEEDMNIILDLLKRIYTYWIDYYKSINPHERKMQVILGLSIYAYKRFKELVEHDLSSTIAGRSCSRGIAESYLILKYLLHIEKDKVDVWMDYQIYGLGKYKFILQKYRETPPDMRYSQFSPEYLEGLVNEFINEEALNMDTNYFDRVSIRDKAHQIGEDELYGQLYDYDTMFEHCMWGAIRESVFVICDNPLHLFHCVPDLDNEIPLKSVFTDIENIMKKLTQIVITLYGLPENLEEEWQKNYA